MPSVNTRLDNPRRLRKSRNEDGEYNGQYWLGIAEEGVIGVTQLGWTRLDEIWAGSLELPARVASGINVVIDNGLYDTAVRDLGAAIESRMKDLSGSESYGQQLVNDFIESIYDSGIFISAFLKDGVLRSVGYGIRS